jgi:hypothetical protein
MPSIQDVANDINAKLDQVANNTAATAAGVVQVNNQLQTLNGKIDQLDAHLQAGLSTLAAGLFAIWERQKEANAVLTFHSQQHATMICLLENSNDLLCGITRKLTVQLQYSERQAREMERLGAIADLVHAKEATEVRRLSEMRAELLKCCPPPEPPIEPCPPPCDSPDEVRYDPKGQDWRPREPRPIG